MFDLTITEIAIASGANFTNNATDKALDLYALIYAGYAYKGYTSAPGAGRIPFYRNETAVPLTMEGFIVQPGDNCWIEA